MEFSKFADEFTKHMTAQFKNLEVRRADVDKLQGQSYHGLVLKDPSGPVGVSVNLDNYFHRLEEGQSMNDVLTEAYSDILQMDLTPPVPDLEMLKDYDMMKQHLILQLVPMEGNEEMLGKVPHRQFLDMAAVCRFLLPREGNGEASILVTHENLKAYGISEETVLSDAQYYSREHHPLTVKNIVDVLFGPGGHEEEGGKNMLWVVSNDCGRYGASAVTYPEALCEIGDRIGADYYLVPSSVHEMLAVPDGTGVDAAGLDAMVHSVNMTEVSEEDRLTNHSYHYDRKRKLLEYAAEYEARVLAEEKKEAACPGDVLSGSSPKG